MGDKHVILYCAAPHETLLCNIRSALARKLPRFSDLAKTVDASIPVALCGSAPALSEQIGQIDRLPGPVVACGTAHDALLNAGIVPQYAVISDPLPVVADLIGKISERTTYCVSSFCDPAVFDKLKGAKVYLWHNVPVQIPEEVPYEEWDDQPLIPGGTSAILRAWPMMAIMGYRDFHFFGFDCSFDDEGPQYAYERHDTENIPPRIKVAIQETGQEFWTAADLAFQCKEFINMVEMAGKKFKITVHGRGLVPAAFAVKLGIKQAA